MSIRAVFIDAGNTLVYEKPSRFEIYAESARRRGVDVAAEEMHRLMRRAHGELPRAIGGAFRYSDPWFERYIERVFHGYLRLDPAELAPLREELFRRFSDPETFALFPGAIELLEGLRGHGLVLGIVSNWSPRLPRLLAALGVGERVDFVLASALERCEKPDPAIWGAALARAGVRADEALHAGDDLEKDLFGPRRAGLRSVLVDHRREHGRDAPRVGDLFELGELVERLL
jgi:REG-2-like HAD superfamily hydrolase